MMINYEVGDPVVCVDARPNLNGSIYLTEGKIYKLMQIKPIPITRTAMGVTDIVVVVEPGPQPIALHGGFHPARFKKLRKATVDIFSLADRPVPVPTKEPEYV